MRGPAMPVSPSFLLATMLTLAVLMTAGCDSSGPPAEAAVGGASAAPELTAVSLKATDGTAQKPNLSLPPAEPELRLPTAGPLQPNAGTMPVAEAFAERAVMRGGSDKQPAEVELVGIELAFDPADASARLNAFHERPGLKSLTLKADIVRIAGRLWLPRTNVTIIARRLVFEDPADPSQLAQIDTTALPHGPPPRNAHKKKSAGRGAHGKSAGSLTLIVDELLPVPAVPEPVVATTPAAQRTPAEPVSPPPLNPRAERLAQLEALEDLVKQGKIREAGICRAHG